MKQEHEKISRRSFLGLGAAVVAIAAIPGGEKHGSGLHLLQGCLRGLGTTPTRCVQLAG